MEKDAAALQPPPSYEETVKTPYSGPPPAYSGAPPPPVRVVYLPAPDFGPGPVVTVCPACQASVTTATRSKASWVAWAVSAVLCCTMLWPCFCVPFCVDSLQDVKHTCPACRVTLGRYRGGT
jgi:lipopolysaccharide-induced tumor necrosis factor-alpha factor